jgi:succinate dehydrogenase / fumarate reductase cytochrome b subunit
MLTSILHRASGIILYLGAIGLVVWLWALAAGQDAYERLMTLVPGWTIELNIYFVTTIIAFHLANGVRHFAFDLGKGFKPKTADGTAWLAILFALAAPVGLFALLHR